MKLGWLELARAVPLPEVASALGMAVTESGGRPVALAPCPACSALTRHPGRRDRRAAIGLTSDGRGWRCHECGEGGDALDLVAITLAGGRLRTLAAPRVAEVRVWYANHRWCDAGPGGIRAIPSIPRVRPRGRARTSSHVERARELQHHRPLPSEVAELWKDCLPVTEDEEVAAWLDRRGMEAGRIADRDLARALSKNRGALPRWAACRARPWTDGWRLVLPCHDAIGAMASLRARLVRDPRYGEPKASAASAGPGSAAGLVLADGLGRRMLAAELTPAWWSADPLRLFVAEGETDFLALASAWSDADDAAPAVLGIVAGAWTEALAERVPEGSTVTIATDADAAGERYARAIHATLAPRCTVLRWCAGDVA